MESTKEHEQQMSRASRNDACHETRPKKMMRIEDARADDYRNIPVPKGSNSRMRIVEQLRENARASGQKDLMHVKSNSKNSKEPLEKGSIDITGVIDNGRCREHDRSASSSRRPSRREDEAILRLLRN